MYPRWTYRGIVRDTLITTRLIWPKDPLREKDLKLWKAEKLPGNLIGRYSLQAWGYRLTNYKGDYDGEWATWNAPMQEYCEQDVAVTLTLWKLCAGKAWDPRCLQIEHKVAEIVARQEVYGFGFNERKGAALMAVLVGKKTELETKLQEVFPPWEVCSTFVPKVNNKKMGYVKDQPFLKRKTVHFDPSSRDHIAARLGEQRGWVPAEFTPDGHAKVDEEILKGLPWPEAKVLLDYLMVDKRLAQLANGKEAWLKRVRNGRIHGDVITNGAVTGRMTHSRPNVAQVPGVKKGKDDEVLYGHAEGYGYECRDLYEARPGKVLVGCDAAALELRDLAGYMARFDDGAYIRVVLEGKKEDGTEIHSVNAKALGCDRASAKVWFYAFIYGAGDFKLGTILNAPKGKEMEYGKRSRARFLKNLPALGKLTKLVQDRVTGKAKKKDGSPAPKYLLGLDGRQLQCRSSHSALNTLLQSAGAVQMKQALVLLDEDLQAAGYVPGVHYEFCANVHDEWQIEVDEDIAHDIGRRAVAAIRRAGEAFSFACPLDGEYKIGRTWAETH